MSSISDLQTLEAIDALVQPGAPSGDDLEYTAAFADFMTLSTGTEERQIGNHIIPAQSPDWVKVFATGCALLEQSRDLRILSRVVRAAIYRYGLPGLARGLSLMARWLETNWNELHPALTVDGDPDPLPRSNAIAEISSPDGLVHSLRQATFLETPVGTVTVATATQLLNGKPAAPQDIVSSIEQLTQVLVEEEGRNQERLAALLSAHAALGRISTTFREWLDSSYWPDISPLVDTISRLAKLVTTTLKDSTEEISEANAPGTSPADVATNAAPARTPSAGLPAKLQTRAEALKALQLARKYFEDNEPSHPAPLLIERVERLADKSFLEIIRDLTPDAVQQFGLLTGKRE